MYFYSTNSNTRQRYQLINFKQIVPIKDILKVNWSGKQEGKLLKVCSS